MKKLTAFLMLVILSFSTFAADYCSKEGNIKDWKPWPWGSEIKIPWKTMQGIWSVTSGDCSNYFIFKFIKAADSDETLVQITQYDPYSCRIIAKGSGFLYSRLVYARMLKKGVSYDLTVHAFNEADMEFGNSNQNSFIQNKVLMALSLYPTGEWDKRTSYEISQFDTSTTKICVGR